MLSTHRSVALALTLLGFAIPVRAVALPAGSDPALRRGFLADSVRVFRLELDSTRARLHSVSKGLASPVDARRLAALLGGIDLIRRDAGAPHRCNGCPGRLNLGFQFGSGPQALGIQAAFPERTVYYSIGSDYIGSGFSDSVAAGLIDIARRALGSDSAMARYVLPAVMWDMPGGTQAQRTDSVLVEVVPVAIERPPPSYPARARAAGIQGTVIVQVLVGRDGEVKDARIRQSIPELDEAALEAVRHWKFKPALAGGVPTAIWVAIPVKFSLH